MQLNFESSQKVCDGHEPAGFHYTDQELFVMFNNGSDTLQYVRADTPEGQFGSLVFDDPADAIYFKDQDVLYQTAYSYSGDEHWITWRMNPEHRIAKYLYNLILLLRGWRVSDQVKLEWDAYR